MSPNLRYFFTAKCFIFWNLLFFLKVFYLSKSILYGHSLDDTGDYHSRADHLFEWFGGGHLKIFYLKILNFKKDNKKYLHNRNDDFGLDLLLARSANDFRLSEIKMYCQN